MPQCEPHLINQHRAYENRKDEATGIYYKRDACLSFKPIQYKFVIIARDKIARLGEIHGLARYCQPIYNFILENWKLAENQKQI